MLYVYTKHAMLLRDKYPDIEAYVFYIDVRTPGKNFDEFQKEQLKNMEFNISKVWLEKYSQRVIS